MQPVLLCRGPAGGEVVPEVQGDWEEVRFRGFCLLQLQRPPVVSVPARPGGPAAPSQPWVLVSSALYLLVSGKEAKQC